MNRNAIAFVGVIVVLALGWFAFARQGGPVAAGPAAALAGPAGVGEAAGGEAVGAASAAALAPGGEAAFAQAAGGEYQLADASLSAYQASLAPLWTWAGEVGTYVDGRTRVRVLTQAGRVSGVEILENASAIPDACLEAQLLYGLAVRGAAVTAACGDMWTQGWAEGLAAEAGQGD